MKHAYTSAPAYWVHDSWLEAGRLIGHARHERHARAAHAFLFDRYPQLCQVSLAGLPPALPRSIAVEAGAIDPRQSRR